jgi:hypothetical protein
VCVSVQNASYSCLNQFILQHLFKKMDIIDNSKQQFSVAENHSISSFFIKTQKQNELNRKIGIKSK